jgi:hypothetical protein
MTVAFCECRTKTDICWVCKQEMKRKGLWQDTQTQASQCNQAAETMLSQSDTQNRYSNTQNGNQAQDEKFVTLKHDAFIQMEQELAQARQRIEHFKIVMDSFRKTLDSKDEVIKELEGELKDRQDLFDIQEERLTDLVASDFKLRFALEKIAKPTYGTENIAFDIEEIKSNYEIICRHYFAAQKIAREALGKDGGGNESN